MAVEFFTPILEIDTGGYLEETHNKVIEYVLNQASKDKDAKKYSLVGKTSYHTDADLCELGFDWCDDLRSIIMDASQRYYEQITGKKLDNYRIDCWAVLLRKGDISSLHTHPGSEISGAYHIKVPTDLEGRDGNLVFIDPRPAARQSLIFAGKSLAYQPMESKGVVFPSWVEHEVYPHFSDQDRISISWNIVLL